MVQILHNLRLLGYGALYVFTYIILARIFFLNVRKTFPKKLCKWTEYGNTQDTTCASLRVVLRVTWQIFLIFSCFAKRELMQIFVILHLAPNDS